MGGDYYVYEHWRLDRDECFYVGMGRKRRAYNLLYRNSHHKAIVAKLHRIGSAVEIKIVANGLSQQEAFALEIERIKFWTENGADLANHTKGGEGTVGYKFTTEQKENIAKIVTEYFKNEENRKKTSAATKRGMTAEVKKKLSEIKKKMPQEQRDKIAYYQRTMSDEQRKKRADKIRLINSQMTPEQKARKSELGRLNAMKRWNKLPTPVKES